MSASGLGTRERRVAKQGGVACGSLCSQRRGSVPERMRTSLPTKVFAAFVVLLVTFAGVSVYSVVQLRRLGGDVGQLHATLLPLPAVIAGLTRDLQGVELVLEQSDPAALRRGVRLLRRVRSSVDRLEQGFAEARDRLTAVDAPRSAAALAVDLARLDRLRAALIGEATRIFDAVERGEAVDRISARRQLRVLRRGLFRFEVDLATAIDTEIAGLTATENAAVWSSIVLGGAGVILGIIITWLTGRLLRPLQTLRDGVEAIARGDFEQPIEVDGTGELADLAADFNRMAEAIARRDAQLSAQQRTLVHQERLATVGRMAAQITHELRNPLSSIGLNSELLLDDLPTDHDGRPLLKSIIREVERLREITEEYLRFARLPRPERRPVDLNHAGEELLEFVRTEMQQAEIRVRLDGDPAARPALVDPNHLRAALLNLLRNAREAIIGDAAPGDSVEGAHGHIVVRVRTLGAMASVSVIDDGPGMDAATQERVLEPFFSTKPQGTGLGLSMVHKIVDANDGSVRLESAPGRGTTVTLLLPLADEAALMTPTMETA